MIKEFISEIANEAGIVNASKFAKPTHPQNLNYRKGVIGLVPDDSKWILDIGFCWGAYLFPLARMYRGSNVFGVDHPNQKQFIEKESFKKYQKQYNVQTYQIDISQKPLPFDDDYFDTILFSETIEHIQPNKLDFVLSEINRVLKKKGILIITTPNLVSFVHRVRMLLGQDFDWDISSIPKFSGTYGHVREYSEKELRNIMKTNGFRVKKVYFKNITYGVLLLDLLNNFVGLFCKRARNNIVMVLKKE